MKLTSTAFKEGEAIPRGYTCDGANVSPPLEWTGVPKTAKTIAIIADDPDAPAGTWVHWVLYNLPGDGLGLIENTPQTETLNGGGVQGKERLRQDWLWRSVPAFRHTSLFFQVLCA
jgi:Raf kinase inhibitor-like YbhB/YbcL family protein